MKSWQVFNHALHVLPRNTVAKIWGLRHGEGTENRMAYYWAADGMNARNLQNPIDRLRSFLEQLEFVGHGHIARATIDILAQPLGGRFAYLEKQESDKGTVDGEAVVLPIAVSRLVEACRKSKKSGKANRENL